MLTLEQVTDYCMNLPDSTQDFPFNQQTMVFKVGGKMFALINIEWWMEGNERINVKCEPEEAIILRENYSSIEPGYHMNKKHWNTLVIHEGELSSEQILEYIHNSYILVQ